MGCHGISSPSHISWDIPWDITHISYVYIVYIMGYHRFLIHHMISHGISPLPSMYILYNNSYISYVISPLSPIDDIPWDIPCEITPSHTSWNIPRDITPISYITHIYLYHGISPLSHTSWGTPRDITPISYVYLIYIPCDIMGYPM